ncbi:uncharacterized protein [Macrobrachium rosenbergii]
MAMKKIQSNGKDRYRLLVSDGQQICSFGMLDTRLNGLVASGEVDSDCIIKLIRYTCDTVEESKKILTISDLDVIKPGGVRRSQGKMDGLTKNAIVEIFEGRHPEEPCLQIMAMKKVPIPSYGKDMYCLAVSDGQRASSFAMLATQLNGLVESGEIDIDCIIKLNRYTCDMGQKSKKILIISDLDVVKPGEYVRRAQRSQGKMVGLTQNAIAEFHEGRRPEKPYLQILAVKKIPVPNDGKDRYRLLVSDGQWSSSFAMVFPDLGVLVESGEVDINCIIRLNRYACETVEERKILMITDLDVVKSGVEVGGKIGEPVRYDPAKNMGASNHPALTEQRERTRPRSVTDRLFYLKYGSPRLFRLKFGSPTNMAGLTLQERAQIAARYEVWRSVPQVQRWWRTVKGRYAEVDTKTIKNCHAKLMATGSVADTQRNGRPSNFSGPKPW